MKFEKISDNKLKILLSSEELPFGADLDEFMLDSNLAKDSFMDLLEEAYDEVGFDAKNYKIQIQAKQTSDGTYIFIVTRILRLKTTKKQEKDNNQSAEIENNINMSKNIIKTSKNTTKAIKNVEETKNDTKQKSTKKVKPRIVPKLRDTTAIYKFRTLDDFIAFCHQLKMQKMKTFKSFCEESILYKQADTYYLVIININDSHRKIGIFYTNITEFSEFYSSNIMKYYSLREKIEPFIEKNALEIGQKL